MTRQQAPTTRKKATADVHERIVQAAIGQLAVEGMRGLTHRRIERRAGLAQGSAKYHFGSLDALIEAVLAYMVEVELDSVLYVSPQLQARATSIGEISPEVWDQARSSYQAIRARNDLVRARFELYLHAATRPELQAIIFAGHQRFISRVADTLPSANPEVGARLVLALVNGMLLQQIAAPDPVLDEVGHVLMVVAGAAAMSLPPLAELG